MGVRRLGWPDGVRRGRSEATTETLARRGPQPPLPYGLLRGEAETWSPLPRQRAAGRKHDRSSEARAVVPPRAALADLPAWMRAILVCRQTRRMAATK